MIFFYLLVFVMPLARHPLWSGRVGDVTIVKYVGAAACIYAVFYLLAGGSRPPFLRSWQARWFLLFSVLASVSYLLVGQDMPLAISPLMSALSFVQLFFVTLVVLDSLPRLRTLLFVLLGSVGFASLHALREWQKSGFAAGYRPGWIAGDPNYFSISALLCLPVAFSLLRLKARPWEWWFCAGACALVLMALTAAASRGAFLGLVAACLVGAWQSRHRARLVGAGVVLLLPIMLLSPSSPLRRLVDPDASDAEAAHNRLETWSAAVRMIAAHPLAGVGAGNFVSALPRFGAAPDDPSFIAHNTYLQVGAELGVPGLLAFVGALYGSVRTTRRVRRATRANGPPLVRAAAEGIEMALAGYAVASFFVSAQYQKLFWLLVFVSACLPRLAAARTPAATSRRPYPVAATEPAAAADRITAPASC